MNYLLYKADMEYGVDQEKFFVDNLEEFDNGNDQTIGNAELRFTREYCVWSCLIQLLFGTYFYLNFNILSRQTTYELNFFGDLVRRELITKFSFQFVSGSVRVISYHIGSHRLAPFRVVLPTNFCSSNPG